MRTKLMGLAAALAALAVPATVDARTPDCADRALVPGADLRRCDLRPLALATLDLHGADLRRANLAGMWLGGGADGPRTVFVDVRLDRADLTGAVLGDNDLTGASFRRADLTGTDFEDATLHDAVLVRADLRGARFLNAGIAGADFTRADLRGASLASTPGDTGGAPAIFRRADLRGADLTAAGLAGAVFDRADLSGADLTGARLTGASFRRATLTRVVWSDTDCPDGTNSDAVGGTCLGHLTP